MDLMTTKEAAKIWGVTIRQVQLLCDRGLVKDAGKLGEIWVIPRGTPKPIDGRTKAAKQAKTKDNR